MLLYLAHNLTYANYLNLREKRHSFQTTHSSKFFRINTYFFLTTISTRLVFC